MRVRHRYAFRTDRALEKWLRERGVRLEPGEICVAHVYEDDIRWHEIEQHLRTLGHRHPIVYTEWSDEEIAAAEWLEVRPALVDSIEVRPEAPFAEICHCCWHSPQRGPFRIVGLPAWRTAGRFFMPGNWHELTLVDAPVRKAISSAGLRGVSFESVLRHRDGTPLQGIAQVKAGELQEGAVVEQGLETFQCRKEYRWFEAKDRGPLRVDGAALRGAADMAETMERFGNEFWGARLLLARQRAAQVLRAAAPRLRLAPIEIA